MSDDATHPAPVPAMSEGRQAGVAPNDSEPRGGGEPTNGRDPSGDFEPEAEASEPDALEEIDYEGRTYSVPKGLKDSVLRHRDYTQKTQELAEQRRHHEAERERHAAAIRTYGTNRAELARIEAINQQLLPLQTLDWATLAKLDPAGTQTAFLHYDRLRQARDHLAHAIAQREHHSAVEGQRQSATQLDNAKAVLARDIPNWSPDLMSKLKDFALSHGFARDELRDVSDPRHIKILHAAWVGEQVLKNHRAADKAGPESAEPVPQVGRGGSPVLKSPERMSTEEWMRWRTSQIRKKGRR